MHLDWTNSLVTNRLQKGAHMRAYKIGINFVPGHEVVLEDARTEVICRVVAVRRDDESIYYDLVPLQMHSEKNERGLSIGRQFTVGIRLDSVNGASWGLRDA